MLSLLTGIKGYLYGALGAVFLLMGITVYVEHLRIESKNKEISALILENKVSNQSVADLTNSLVSVNLQLTQKAKDDASKQALIEKGLSDIKQKDAYLTSLQGSLLSRKSSSSCPVPKDLENAWSQL